MIKWVLFTLLVLFEGIADTYAKKYSLSGRNSQFLLSITAYVLCNGAWILSLRKGMDMSTGNVLFSMANILIAVAIGLSYGEEMTRQQWLGVVLAFVVVWLCKPQG
jgi:multidrug transporter EmrE-like cation transporter